MMYRLPIHSRLGNLLLIAIGSLFLIAGTATFAFAVISTWGYAGPTDRAMQIVLIGCAAFGVLLVMGARKNLSSAGRAASRRAA